MENKSELEIYMNLKLVNEFKDSLTDYQKKEMEKLIEVFGKKFLIKIENKEAVYKFLKYEVDGDWCKRLKIIREKLRHDSSTLYSFRIRYGDFHGPKKWEEKTQKTTQNLESFKLKFGEENGILEHEKYKKSKKSIGLDVMIERYGEKKGKEKWNSYLKKWKKTISEKGGWSNGLKLEELQNKFGIEKGFKIWTDKKNKQSYRFSIDYYLKKYGNEEGKLKWEEYCKKMSKTSLNALIEKHGEKIGKEKYEKILINNVNRLRNQNSFSSVSQKMMWEIYFELNDDLKKNSFFSELNKEYIFYNFDNDVFPFKAISVDFKCKNKIIEFNGDYWHANPSKYLSEQEIKYPDTKKIAKDIWRKDEERYRFLKEKSNQVLVIWELDYRKNKEEVINRCLKFINS